jgi:hypothetical protein
MPRKLVRDDQPKQTTKGGLEIPVPKRDTFFKTLQKAAEKAPTPTEQEPSRPDPSSR